MEFLLLLVVTLIIAVVVSGAVVFSFRKPIEIVLTRLIGEDISVAWRKFLMFALFVVGIASGVNIHKLEQFLSPEYKGGVQLTLTPEFWGLEIYRTIIGSLAGLAWALLVFFVASLMVYAVIKLKEMVSDRSNSKHQGENRQS